VNRYNLGHGFTPLQLFVPCRAVSQFEFCGSEGSIVLAVRTSIAFSFPFESGIHGFESESSRFMTIR
jgi:hypothetical protein